MTCMIIWSPMLENNMNKIFLWFTFSTGLYSNHLMTMDAARTPMMQSEYDDDEEEIKYNNQKLLHEIFIKSFEAWKSNIMNQNRYRAQEKAQNGSWLGRRKDEPFSFTMSTIRSLSIQSSKCSIIIIIILFICLHWMISLKVIIIQSNGGFVQRK